MLQRQLELPPRHVYPPDEWRLVEDFRPEKAPVGEEKYLVAGLYVMGLDQHDVDRQRATLSTRSCE